MLYSVQQCMTFSVALTGYMMSWVYDQWIMFRHQQPLAAHTKSAGHIFNSFFHTPTDPHSIANPIISKSKMGLKYDHFLHPILEPFSFYIYLNNLNISLIWSHYPYSQLLRSYPQRSLKDIYLQYDSDHIALLLKII